MASVHELNFGDHVIIDLSGIEMVNQSFMNSMLAELYNFINLSDCSLSNNTAEMQKRFNQERTNIQTIMLWAS